MEKFVIKETNKTPAIIFDPIGGRFDIRGRSIPENSLGFYAPVLDFIDNYSVSPAAKTVLNVRFDFFNTSSSNRIHAIFKKFEQVYMDNRDVTIRWYCERGDENMLDAGEDFKAILNVPFEIVEVDNI